MIRITDIQALGTIYTVADKDGNLVNSIQIIPHTEILDAAVGEYNPDLFENITQYLDESIAALTGFESVDFNKIYWLSTYDEEVVLADIIEYAMSIGCDKIILELLKDE